MGKETGFLEYARQTEKHEEVKQRVKHFKEFTLPLQQNELTRQGARCMNCGVPFCHSGCPLGNLIPDFNDAVFQGQWQKASQILHQTNNFPEFTGRLCPAPCEEACVLNINSDPVTIENIEKNIVEQAFANQWLGAEIITQRSGKNVVIIGSGPTGLAAAEQLNRAGHMVTVIEKDDQPGGLLRYGIPDFKLDKSIIDRRLKLMRDSGIVFRCNWTVGRDVSYAELSAEFDAVAVCVGANQRRALPVDGHELSGVIQAMDFLTNNNRAVAGQQQLQHEYSANEKTVVVIGGGDTGSDCIGTAIRQGAHSVLNFEIMPKPPSKGPFPQPWPHWPLRLRISTSHQEGVSQSWNLATKAFIANEQGKLVAIETTKVEWNEQMELVEVAGTEKLWPCDMVILAMGFTGTAADLAAELNVDLNEKQNFSANDVNYQLNQPGLFAAGDCRRGQSLIVWAISEGREMAHQIDNYLMGQSLLPKKGSGDLPGA